MIDLSGTNSAITELEVNVRGLMIVRPTTEAVFDLVVDFFVGRKISQKTEFFYSK